MTENNNNENNGPTLKRMVGHTQNWLAFFVWSNGQVVVALSHLGRVKKGKKKKRICITTMKYYRAMFRLYAAGRSRSLDSLLLVLLLYVTSHDMEIRQIVSLRFFVWEISVLLLLLYYKV